MKNNNRILVTKEDIISMYSISKIDQQTNARKYYEAMELRNKFGYGSLRVSRIVDMPLGAVHYWFSGYEPKSVKGIIELESMDLLPLTISLDKSFEHFIRTFGLRYSDGCIYHQERNNSYTGYLCFGTKEDAEWYVNDSLKIWNIKMNVHYSTRAYYVYLPASLVRLMILLGSPVGRKTSQAFSIPIWIFSLPKELKMALLDGIFAGDGSVPKLKPSQKSSESLKLQMNAEESVVKEFASGFMLDVVELLESLDVRSSKPLIKYTEPKFSKKGIITYPVNVRVFTRKDNMIKFLENIKYTYCKKGHERGKIILEILKK